MVRSFLVILTAMALTGLQPAQAADKTDHPLLRAYEGSVLRKKDVKEFDEYQAFRGYDNEAKEVIGEVLEGKVTRIFYGNPKDRSVLEMFRNYETALKSAGAEILYQCNQKKYECAKQYAGVVVNKYNGMSSISNTGGRYMLAHLAQEGGTAYVAVGVNKMFTDIHVVEIKGMETDKVSVNAAALAEGLGADGYVIVEGIYFDTDKATLKPASDAALSEVAKLLGEKPELKVYVVGHTDMQGSLAHNMTLSEKRAKAVVAVLSTDYGVDKARMEGHGVGPLAPKATNTQESGRAQNRRVVLVAR